jgi:SAM-dependent methyltransferase
LYENLSASARDKFALVQTPQFVLNFILDRTLTPALDAFGLQQVRLIDPACGSGHFLLATFSRLFRLWQQREPATNPPALAQRSLDAVFGVDLNPFAVAITRFRLLIAALEASGVTRLRDALDFHTHVAAGDSLLHGTRPRDVGGVQRSLHEDRLQFFYETEDAEEVKRILSQTYHVVVGNPPYINVSDPVLREAYRERFSTCHGKYQLGVPFTERFFDLTLYSDDPKINPAGWMGMIVSNAFMRLSFGKVLVENFLSRRDVTHVIDTSGLNLPAYGTPTVILLAKHRSPLVNSPIRVVRGIVGVSTQGEDLASSSVWREIVERVDQPGFVGKHVSVSDAPRSLFARHPWTMRGGGAAELKAAIDASAESNLEASADPGVQTLPLADDIFIRPLPCLIRSGTAPTRPFSTGNDIRDWVASSKDHTFVPQDSPPAALWTFRTTLANRKSFKKTQIERGKAWWDYGMTVQRRQDPPLVALAHIVTHNHFALCRERRVFDQHALVIRPLDGMTETLTDILGLLNSSIGCFWLRQVCHDKGGGGVGGGLAAEPWERFMCIDAKKLKRFPVPAEKPVVLTNLIQEHADARAAVMPDKVCAAGVPTRPRLDAACKEAASHLARMIAFQEELDWLCYRLYGLVDDDLTFPSDEIPSLGLGHRAFEILMARQIHGGTLRTTWFERHGSTPITDFPSHWPEGYRRVCSRRLEAIQQNHNIALIEQSEYKRRWNLPTWEEMEQAALKNWLLDRMEANAIWHEHALVSCGQLRDALACDSDWVSVAALYRGRPVEDLDALVAQLSVDEAVPFLPVLRYKESGLRKRAEWEQVWDLQRKEDAGETVEIPVPPKYRTDDFQKSHYWRLRGGLDVPKERFILYPLLERDADASPVLGWAGWNHLQQARALAGYYQRMRTEEGWDAERLKPILAGLLDLMPWLLQWHNDIDPESGVRLGEYLAQFAESQCQELGFSPEEARAWQPVTMTRPNRRARRVRRSQ